MKSVFKLLLLFLSSFLIAQPTQVGPLVDWNSLSPSMVITDDNDIYISYLKNSDELWIKKKDGGTWSALSGALPFETGVTAHKLVYNSNLDLLYCIYARHSTGKLYLQIYNGAWYGLTDISLSGSCSNILAVMDEAHNIPYIAVGIGAGTSFYKFDSGSSAFESILGPAGSSSMPLWMSDLSYSPVDGWLYFSALGSSGATLYRRNDIAWTTVTTNFMDGSTTGLLRSKIVLNENTNHMIIAYTYNYADGARFGVKSYNCSGPGSSVIVPESFHSGYAIDIVGCSVNPTNGFVVSGRAVASIVNFFFSHSGVIYEPEMPSGYGDYGNLIHDSDGNLYWTKEIFSDLSVYKFDNYQVGITDQNTNQPGIFPNPASDYVYLNGSDTYQFCIIDLNGKIVKSGRMFSAAEPISLKGLDPANYILLLRDVNNDYFKYKLVVQ